MAQGNFQKQDPVFFEATAHPEAEEESLSRFVYGVPPTVAEAASPVIDSLCRAFGFEGSPLINHWLHIVGEETAKKAFPVRIIWRKKNKGKENGELLLKCRAGNMLELQYELPVILKKVNRFLGRQAISKIKLTPLYAHMEGGETMAKTYPQNTSKIEARAIEKSEVAKSKKSNLQLVDEGSSSSDEPLNALDVALERLREAIKRAQI